MCIFCAICSPQECRTLGPKHRLVLHASPSSLRSYQGYGPRTQNLPRSGPVLHSDPRLGKNPNIRRSERPWTARRLQEKDARMHNDEARWLAVLGFGTEGYTVDRSKSPLALGLVLFQICGTQG